MNYATYIFPEKEMKNQLQIEIYRTDIHTIIEKYQESAIPIVFYCNFEAIKKEINFAINHFISVFYSDNLKKLS
ncbi:MAG: hypothetical protein LBL13_06055, partial [Bacteroidales bacterium]|nr:hypothetical protein [Bacteroidales bacterium]